MTTCISFEFMASADVWQHQIRVEAILAPKPHQRYPVCIDGRRACLPVDCGGPSRFMALRQNYDHYHIMDRLLEIIEDRGRHDHREELEMMSCGKYFSSGTQSLSSRSNR